MLLYDSVVYLLKIGFHSYEISLNFTIKDIKKLNENFIDRHRDPQESSKNPKQVLNFYKFTFHQSTELED